MSHQLATIVLAACGALLVIAGLLFFLRPRWLLGWLKGMAVFGIILSGLYTLVIAVNVSGYRSLEGLQTVATISIQKQTDQRWRVTLDSTHETPVVETLGGDQWQIDARILRFSGPMQWLGVAPGYRLEQLSGRYTSLEQERSEPKTVIGLGKPIWPDLWEFDRELDGPFVEGIYVRATFMPMRDGAIYDVRLSASGMVAVPVNDRARDAVQEWDQ